MDIYTKRPLVRLHRAAWVYAALLLFGLIFTQALRATASAVLFWFLLLVPVLSVVYVLIGKALIRIYVSADTTKVEKLDPVTYELRIINASPFAYPFLEAIICVPEKDGVRCTEQSMTLSLAPLGSYIVNQSTSFKYRGTYEIGVRCLYVSDFLGLFSIRLDVDIYDNVLVFPRKMGMAKRLKTSATDIPNDSPKLVFSTEKAEISNIRPYVPGDSLKSIHWKLSSKGWDGGLMVKDFNTNTSQNVYMLCDFSRAIPPEVFEDEEARLEREKAEREEALRPKDKHVRLKQAKPTPEQVKAERAAKKAAGKAARRARSGMRAEDADMAAMVDGMIDRAAEAKSPKKEKPEPKPHTGRFGRKTGAGTGEPIAETDRRKTDGAALAMGGIIRAEDAPDMDEFCADGVVELAIAAVLHELRSGHTVTLLWTDARQDGGVAAVTLTCPEDFDVVFPVFATTPPCSEKENSTTLLPLITESLNVTIRICTSNIDPLSLSRYAAVPGLFGGAGTGCVAEVLLFNPEERYEDAAIRREYVEMSRMQLAQEGVDLTEMKVLQDESGHRILQPVSH